MFSTTRFAMIKKAVFCSIGVLVFVVVMQTAYFSRSPNGIISDIHATGVTITNDMLSGYMGKIDDPTFITVPLHNNFGKTFGVGNYRGALPTAHSIILLKEKYKVKTIISLIPAKQMGKDVIKTIHDQGLTRINIPLDAYPPSKTDRKKIITAFQNGHVFVHCMYGADRTGAIVARAWVELTGESPEKAYKDMLTYNPKVESSIVYKAMYIHFKDFIYHGLH